MTNFKVLKKMGKARLGKLKTPHGIIETPNFSPVGTQATVKALSQKQLEEIGVQMVLANTYHLMLRPTADLVQKMGGLHKFMSWNHPIMTDSGGYQVFSLGVALEHGDSKVMKKPDDDREPVIKPRLNSITEEGVLFQSHLDGSKHMLSPENSMKLQFKLGADLIVAFDDHESSHFNYQELEESLNLTERWAIRSTNALKKLKSEQMMFGVIHGGLEKDLRVRSAKFTDEHFPAIAIGGIYSSKGKLYELVDWVTNVISEEKPRHLLGIGEVEDIFEAVERGMDLFDCVAPTRRARNGSLYISPTSGGNAKNSFTLNIVTSKYKADPGPIDKSCTCYTCQTFSKAYLRHLYMAKEILFHELATYHNVYFMTKMVEKIREAIKKEIFNDLKKDWLG
jgi:queuine tRNA-ribosyltransferase